MVHSTCYTGSQSTVRMYLASARGREARYITCARLGRALLGQAGLGRARQGWAGSGRAGQGREGPGRAGQADRARRAGRTGQAGRAGQTGLDLRHQLIPHCTGGSGKWSL